MLMPKLSFSNADDLNESIVSNRPKWDNQHNHNTLVRYVKCRDKDCQNSEHSQDYDEARHKIEGYEFDPESEKFTCSVCQKTAHSEAEYNEDSNLYLFPNKYTIIMSAYDGNERYEDIYLVEASTPRNAYAASIRAFRKATNARGYISDIHIATYQGHLNPLYEGEYAYRNKNKKSRTC